MLYAILAYHVEEEVTSWTPQADAALMRDLDKVHERLNQQGRMGPAARLGGLRGRSPDPALQGARRCRAACCRARTP